MSLSRAAFTIVAAAGLIVGGTGSATAGGTSESIAATTSADATILAPSADMRQATAAEQQQMSIDSTRALYPDITDAEAVAYNSAASKMAQLAYKLEEKYPDSYARYVVTPGKNFKATVYFKNASTATLAAVTSAGVPGVSADNTAKFTEAQQLALTKAAFDPIAKLTTTRSVGAAYDWGKDQVTVNIDPVPGVSLDSVLASAPATLSLPNVLDATGRAAATRISYVPGGRIEGTVLSGGTALSQYTGSNQPLRCTAAFGVIGNYGVGAGKQGLLTAEHCGTPLAYEARVPLSKITIYDGTVKADSLMFVPTNGESARRDFIYSQTSSSGLLTKPALATGSVGAGAKVCTYGSKTGPIRSVNKENCDIAVVTGYNMKWCDPNNGPCYDYYNQVVTANRITDHGDSGGPWFINNTALGISSAAQWGGNEYSTYQPISDAIRKTGAGVIVAG